MRKETIYKLSAWEPITPTQYNRDTARWFITNKEFKTKAEVKAEKGRLKARIPNIKFYLIEQTTKVWSD